MVTIQTQPFNSAINQSSLDDSYNNQKAVGPHKPVQRPTIPRTYW